VSWELIVGVVIVALGAWIIRTQDREIDALRIRAEEAEAWSGHWEQMAEHAAEEAEAARKRYATLQGLYTRLVREQLAANWPLVAHYAAMKRARR